MRKDSPIGTISKTGQTEISFDLGGHSVFWCWKAEELNRMIWAGVEILQRDADVLRAYIVSKGEARLEPKPTTGWVSFFLAALAIENLLKGCLMQIHPEYIKQGRFRGGVIGCHNLLQIARDARITLDADEKDFCELAGEAILTFGRYPTGKNRNDSPTEFSVSAAAFPVYRRLYLRLHNRLLKRQSKKEYGPDDTPIGAASTQLANSDLAGRPPWVIRSFTCCRRIH